MPLFKCPGERLGDHVFRVFGTKTPDGIAVQHGGVSVKEFREAFGRAQ
nr:hypothetical protein [Nonomuraea zeae]